MTRYDTIGRTYAATRAPDRRIERRIHAALGGAATVVNVGAGTGSYEPSDRAVVAVEPSLVMLAQRRADAAPAVQGAAEHLPFPDGCFDAALASLTIHHWTDWEAGLAEMRRVARRVVVFGWDAECERRFWLTDEYFPEAAADDVGTPTLDELAALLGPIRVEAVPVPADCLDGFYAAYWARPEAYLDPDVRAGISCFALRDADLVAARIARLRADLESGAWDARHGDLRVTAEYDFGYRLVIAG
jgi:SAM-dependent methyltransferase